MMQQRQNINYSINGQLSSELNNAITSWKTEMKDYIMARNPCRAFQNCENKAKILIDTCMNEGWSDGAWEVDRKFAEFKAKHLFGEAYRQASKLELDVPSFIGGSGKGGCYTGPTLIGEVFKQIETKVDEAKDIVNEYNLNKNFFGKFEEKVYLQFNKTKSQMTNGR